MNSLKELLSIGKNNGATSAGKAYLLRNPAEFFELLKQDLLLAEQYVDFFGTQDIEVLIRYCHNRGETFFDEMFKRSEQSDKFSLLTKPFVVITENNVKARLLEMTDVETRGKVQDDSELERKFYNYYYKSLFLFKSPYQIFYHQAVGDSHKHDLKNCQIAYNQNKHPEHIAFVVKRIVCAIISKVKTPELFNRELLKNSHHILFTLLELNNHKEIQIILSMVHDTVLRMELLKAKKPGESLFINELMKAQPASMQTLALIYERLKNMDPWNLNVFFNYISSSVAQEIRNKSILFVPKALEKDDQITNLSEVILLGKSSGAIGAGLQFLLKNPENYFSLIKEDISLALEYTKLFSQDEVTNMVSTIHAKGNKFFTEISNLAQNPEKINPSGNKLEIKQDNIKDYILQIKDKIKRYPSLEHEGHGSYYYGLKYLFRMSSWYSLDQNDNYSFMDMNEENCAYAYKQLKENMDIIRTILSILLQKMQGSLDYEFANQSSVLSRLWSGNELDLLTLLHNEKRYNDLENVINLTSGRVLFPQLEKLIISDKMFLTTHVLAIIKKMKGVDNQTVEKFLNKVYLFSILLQLKRYDQLILCITSISATVLHAQLVTNFSDGKMIISHLVQALPQTEQVLNMAIMQLKQLDANDLDQFFRQIPITFLTQLKEKSLLCAQKFYELSPVLCKQHFKLTDKEMNDLIPGFNAQPSYNLSALVSYSDLMNQLKDKPNTTSAEYSFKK